MTSLDFEYDGLNLSDWGYIVCEFDGDGSIETISNGSELTFNTVPMFNGAKNGLIDTEYEECIETTFQICKGNCNGVIEPITMGEFRDLVSWLNRRGFHKFKVLDNPYLDFYYEGSFNINRIEVGGVLLGLELTLKTNSPYATHEEVVLNFEVDGENDPFTIVDVSDDEDYHYPIFKITCLQAGDLELHNDREDRTTYVRGCSKGEILTFDYPIISSSLNSHKIQDDFNFVFPRIAGDFVTKENKLTFSIPCQVEMRYSPAVKVGL